MSEIVKHSYFYKTEIDFSPNLSNIHLLYKPIIGNNAYTLYLQMLNEIKTPCFNIDNKRSLYSLFNESNLSQKVFHICRKTLESVGLLKTFLDDNNEKEKYYYFILKHPLEFSNFIANSKLKKLLSIKLMSDKVEELYFLFDSNKIPLSAKDISVSIDEVFKEEVSYEYDFNFNELYSRIASITSLNIVFSMKTKEIINSFFKNFSLSINEIEKCILNSIIDFEGNFVVDDVLINNELTIFTNKVNNINFHEILKINRNNLLFYEKTNENELTKIFLDYTNLKSEQYLTSIQKQQLDSDEILIIRSLRRDFYLPDPVINILIDFSLRKTYGKINIKYIKKVAKTLSVLNLIKIEDIYNYLLDVNIKPSTKKYYKNFKTEIKENHDDNLNIVDIIV